jgi:hypothetical protein
MVKGVQLSLMIGPAVPVPVSRDVIEHLRSVQVTTNTELGKPSAFQLTFELNNRSPITTLFMVAAGVPIPLVRVVIVATVAGTPQVLMDGVMTHHQFAPGESGRPGTLTVIGEDLSRVMDYLPLDGIPYPAMPPEARVLIMLAKYALLGVIPMVIPSVLIDVPIPVQEIPRQQGTDLKYILKLARDVGYTFYLTPGPVPGTSIAYWGPLLKVGVPQPALNVDMDAFTNVESLSFAYDAEQYKLPVLMIQEPNSKVTIPIPVPDITPLNPPLGLVPPIPKGFDPIRIAAKLSPVRAAVIGLAMAAQKAQVVKGTGKLNVIRYGRPLRPRELVGVRGAGPAFDGLFFVQSVTHEIKRGEYTQSFTLTRNGLISTLPRVPA